MTARAFEIDGHAAQNKIRGSYPDPAAATVTRYRLDVIAFSVADVIASAGGWLYDRAMAGWDVNLVVDERCHARSLQILGIQTVPVRSATGSTAKWSSAQAIAVAAEVFNTDARVRDNVIAALEHGLTEVTLWGDTWPAEFQNRAEHVHHRLSGAARVFKAHALTAAELPLDSINETEVFRGGSRWSPPYEPDLMPVV